MSTLDPRIDIAQVAFVDFATVDPKVVTVWHFRNLRCALAEDTLAAFRDAVCDPWANTNQVNEPSR